MYARGHYLFLRAAHGGPPEELLRCGKYFERARALDPSFAPAVAGLANFYAVAARRGVLPDFHETFGRAIQLSEEATRMDPTLAIPHVHFGVKALYLDDDWDLAGREFSVAVMLEPDYVEARRFHGIWLGLVDRPRDALRQMEAAAALEPDYPLILSSLAAARVAVGDLAGGEVALRETLRLAPTHGAARERLVRLLEDSGRFEEAVAERRRSATAAGADAFLTGWARAGAEGYRRALRESLLGEAERLEASLLEKRAPAPNDIFAPPILRLGAVYARLGDWKRVRECRLRAMAERPGMARWFDTAEMRPAAQSKTQAFE
jgi:tetratricopeptide (TPR) repeat protein